MSKPTKAATKTGAKSKAEALRMRPTNNPERYKGRSRKEYQDAGKDAAIQLLKKTVPKKILGAKGEDRLGVEQVRAVIEDELKPDQEIQVTVADFWLGLTKTEGRARRSAKSPPAPHNPFTKGTRPTTATKEEVERWDIAWRKRLAKQAVARIFNSSGSSSARAAGKALLSDEPWLMFGHGQVIGCALDMPSPLLREALKEPRKISVQWMTLEKALLYRRWIDVGERELWLERYKHEVSAVMAKMVRLTLMQHVVDAGSKETKRRRKKVTNRVM